MKAYKVYRNLFFILPGVIILLGSSCGSRQERESRTVAEDRERDELVTQTVEEPDDLPIPTSVEIVELLQRAGAPYILGISNPTSNVDRYFTGSSKALNLGVYGADLSYASVYEMQQDIRRYLQVSKQLIDELNISTSFNQYFVQRVERNLDEKDSLINIVAESFYDTWIFLNDNRRDDLSLLVMTGSWIEGMYLTSQIAIGARDNTEITDIILQQDEPLGNLLALMEDYRDDSIFDELYQDLDEIYDFINDLQSPMTSQQIDTFSEKIEQLRSGIIT